MGRRTKEELIQANYYEWVQVRDSLKTKKKSGDKLTTEEKRVVQFNPTPEKPWKGEGGAAPLTVQKQTTQLGQIQPANIQFVTKGGSFVCLTIGGPRTDEHCMLFCEVEGCPFYGKGYFRSRGIKF